MEERFIIPLSYEEVFARLGPRESEAIAQRQLDLAGSPQRTSAGVLQGDGLIPFFLKSCTTTTYIRQLSNGISYAELKQLRRIIIRGAVDRNDGRDGSHRPLVRSLMAKGIVMETRIGDKDVVFAPLEICLGLPFEIGEEIASLLMAFNKYTVNIVKSIAAAVGIPNSAHRLKLSALLYKSQVEAHPRMVADLAGGELALMRKIFFSGGEVRKDELLRWDEADGPAGKGTGAVHFSGRDARSYSYWRDDLMGVLDSSGTPAEEGLPPVFGMALRLIAKGLLMIPLREQYYYHDYGVRIPAECMGYLEERFYAEMDGKRRSIEKDIYEDEPSSSFSYGGRILDDMRKLQVATACGLVEHRIDGMVKKNSVVQIARLLKVEEGYVDSLLALFHDYISSNSLIDEGSPSQPAVGPDPVEVFRAALDRMPVRSAVIDAMAGLDRWVRMDRLIDYLQSHSVLFRSQARKLTKEELEGHLLELFFLGQIMVSGDAKLMKKCPLGAEILKDHRDPSGHSTIPPEDRPIVVQGNMEILVPYNAHLSVIKSISSLAGLTVLDRMLHFTITKNSLIGAVEKGWREKKILSCLRDLSSVAVPQAVERFIETICAKRGEVLIAPAAAVIKCSGLGIRERIISMREINCYPLEGTDDYLIVIEGRPKDIEKLLKKKGIFAEVRKVSGDL